MITPRLLLLVVSTASAAILAGALIGQYGFDLYPCDLCIYQRWPHGLVMALGLIGAFYVREDKKRYFLLVLCCIILMIGSAIATYHSGVEMGWFAGPDACSAKASEAMSLEQLRQHIKDAALVSCDQAMAYIFGLSMAAWNALISLGIVCAITGAILYNRHHRRAL